MISPYDSSRWGFSGLCSLLTTMNAEKFTSEIPMFGLRRSWQWSDLMNVVHVQYSILPLNVQSFKLKRWSTVNWWIRIFRLDSIDVIRSILYSRMDLMTPLTKYMFRNSDSIPIPEDNHYPRSPGGRLLHAKKRADYWAQTFLHSPDGDAW